MGGVSPFSARGHTHLSWEPLPFPALQQAPITAGYVAKAIIIKDRIVFRCSLDEHDGRWYIAYRDNGRQERCQLRYRFLVECAIGRKLGRDEVVHHIDGNKTNDSLENLEVLTSYQHARKHATLERGPEHRFCPDCKLTKHNSEFYIQTARSYGKYLPYCKPCHRTRVKANRSGKTWYCEVCDTEITNGQKTRHLQSKTHQLHAKTVSRLEDLQIAREYKLWPYTK